MVRRFESCCGFAPFMELSGWGATPARESKPSHPQNYSQVVQLSWRIMLRSTASNAAPSGLRIYTDEKLLLRDRTVLEKISRIFKPTRCRPRPSPAHSRRTDLITCGLLFVADCDCNHPNPGRVTILV